jgi:hypothetical protein
MLPQLKQKGFQHFNEQWYVSSTLSLSSFIPVFWTLSRFTNLFSYSENTATAFVNIFKQRDLCNDEDVCLLGDISYPCKRPWRHTGL